MKLSQAEALAVLDDHYRCIWHVYSHFYDHRGHEDVYISIPESDHNVVLVLLLHGAVDQAYSQVGIFCGELFIDLLRRSHI